MSALCKGLLLAMLLARAGAAVGSPWYVNGVNGSDNHNCRSPVTACKTIGHTIAQAATGDAVMVAAATYTENLTFGTSLEIIGAGSAHTVIDGGEAGSVVDIPIAYAHVTLSGVTLTHGKAAEGGGIYNVGTLTLVSSSVTDNYALSTGATLVGAGIYNNGGTVWIDHSTVSGNRAGPGSSYDTNYVYGGGVANSGTLTISNSTISGNTAIHPANFHSYAYGGGIFNFNGGRLTITNSTLSGNRALGVYNYAYFSEGGGIFNGASRIISSSTIARNLAFSGGGIQGSATLHNVVVADNGSGNIPGNCVGTMSSEGYNLSSDGSCDFRGPGDLNSTDPKLGTLGNYGGPTQTIPLLSGSPAIDAGNPSGCTDALGHLLTTDQRGYPRHDKEDTRGCDIGAYEHQGD